MFRCMASNAGNENGQNASAAVEDTSFSTTLIASQLHISIIFLYCNKLLLDYLDDSNAMVKNVCFIYVKTG